MTARKAELRSQHGSRVTETFLLLDFASSSDAFSFLPLFHPGLPPPLSSRTSVIGYGLINLGSSQAAGRARLKAARHSPWVTSGVTKGADW